MQWLQDPSQSNVDNLNNVRRETSRYFRKKEKEYLITKIDGLETKSKIKNNRDLYMGINDFQKGYQPRNNIVKKGERCSGHRLPKYFGHVEDLFLPPIECTGCK
jgi:hypothetical protein